MESLVSDLRLAVRALARDRRVTLAAVVALALGIGANTLDRLADRLNEEHGACSPRRPSTSGASTRAARTRGAASTSTSPSGTGA